MNRGCEDVHIAVERVARVSYGRLLAFLAARSRDLAASEDALGDALVAALRTWPRDGVPARPEAWLLTAARNALTDAARHRRVVAANQPELRRIHALPATPAGAEFPDERLRLLFVCTHPAIAPAVRAPLMLQTILGLDAAAIAPAFLVSPAAMGQRLVRAKVRIRDAGLRFVVPSPEELPKRLHAVLEAVYTAFGLGWEAISQVSVGPTPTLAEEALWIARDLNQLLPGEPEVLGLLALLLFCHARRTARRGPGGDFIPLAEQDPRMWDQAMIAEAESLLASAAASQRPGRFQLEAAIQSVHSERGRTGRAGRTEWGAIVTFYEHLLRLAPSVGARTAHAAATAEASGARAGLACLDGIAAKAASGYQPYWAVRGHLLGQVGPVEEAAAAYDRAIGLSADPAVRQILLSKRRALGRHGG